MRIAVIGAGLAGLAAAQELRAAGAEVVVFEARDHVGGRVWSQTLPGGWVIERGAEFVLPGHEVLEQTATALGLTLYDKGTTYGDREPRGGLGVTREQLLDAYRALSAAAVVPGRLKGSASQAVESLDIPPGAREALIARLEVSTAYSAADLDATVLSESGASFGGYVTRSVSGGNQSIALALAAEIGPALHLDSAVRKIGWREQGVTVCTAAGETEADLAVVSIPAGVMHRVKFDPPLPAAKAAAISAVRYGHAAKLFLPLRSEAPPSATLCVPKRYWTFTQLTPQGSWLPVAGSFAGSKEGLERLEVDRGPGPWTQSVKALRPDLQVAGSAAVLSTWSDDPWVKAAYSARSRTSPMDDALLAQSVGPLHFAGEHTAGVWHALMEGALRSGRRAASEILGLYARAS
jgi:monoamine oxidase